MKVNVIVYATDCLKSECKWTYNKQMNELIFRPEKSMIKGFGGDKMIKVIG